ncbi:hypothetical protein NBRC116493_04540 [Aurantivibrio infirmus]
MTINAYESPESSLQENFQHSPEITHCGIGISAFIMTMLLLIIIICLIGYAGYLEVTTPGGVDETSPQAIIAGLGLILSGVLVLVSLVLSIVSICRKNKKKLFGILALSLNIILFLLVAGLMVIGSLAS